MRVCQIGNGGAPFSTENELRRALESNGHHVDFLQENAINAFDAAAILAKRHEVDLIIWTRTGWNPPVPHEQQLAMLLAANRAGVPVVGYHLDRFHGLARESLIATEPFFKVDLLCTADGGHDDEWKAAGIEHVWFPPAVDAAQAEALGTFKPEYASDIAFVGSWRPGYHPEWPHRAELVAFLKRTYGPRVKFWPEKNQPAVRGPALADLYQSVKVVVGDSCLAGGITKYHSDRIPESLGRGAFLIHPHVLGVTGTTDDVHLDHRPTPLYVDEVHLVTWDIGDWGTLKMAIDIGLEDAGMRSDIATAGRAHVLANHTYATRMATLTDLLVERGMVKSEVTA